MTVGHENNSNLLPSSAPLREHLAKIIKTEAEAVVAFFCDVVERPVSKSLKTVAVCILRFLDLSGGDGRGETL